MSLPEKRAWIMALVTIAAYASYLAIVLGAARGAPLAAVAYAPALLWTVGGAIVVNIVLSIIAGTFSPADAGSRDERDRQISRLGEYIGQSFLVIGGVGALILAMIDVDQFWIANVIYLAFALSSILGSATKIIAYRRGFQTW